MKLHRARLNAADELQTRSAEVVKPEYKALLSVGTCEGSKNLNHRDKYVNPGPPEFAAES
jgi:hypothetical protein